MHPPVLPIRSALLAAALLLSSTPWAAESSTSTKLEIEHLIAHLGASGCQFNRNGSWYSAARAVSHLNRKYEYLLERKLVPNAEAFIDNAAATSSSSGKPYLVRCKGEAEVSSADWFRAELTKFREASAHAGKQP